MYFKIRNQHLALCIDSHGAEVVSLQNIHTGRQVIWNADPQYWDEHSPILFPCVGGNWNGHITIDNQSYALPKHGLVKHMDFTLTSQTEDTLVFSVQADEQTLQSFPYHFSLHAIYQLNDRSLQVSWVVKNHESELDMPFMIGGHPAFLLPDFDATDSIHGYLQIPQVDCLVSSPTLPHGFVMPQKAELFPLDHEHRLSLMNDTFRCDTILDLRGMAQQAVLLDKTGRQLQEIIMNEVPVLALWSPQDGCCPFICVEPWWGCCDSYESSTPFNLRPFVNNVTPQGTWKQGYQINVLD